MRSQNYLLNEVRWSINLYLFLMSLRSEVDLIECRYLGRTKPQKCVLVLGQCDVGISQVTHLSILPLGFLMCTCSEL